MKVSSGENIHKKYAITRSHTSWLSKNQLKFLEFEILYFFNI